MPELGIEEAQKLLDAGWRQGSVFRPNELIELPANQPDDAFLIVISQSCTVVSQMWDKDPVVELAVAKRAREKYNPKKPEAVGKNFRTLLVPVDGDGFDSLLVEVYTRFFVPRTLLLQFTPDGPSGRADLSKIIAGWMGRHYTRTALPNRLVILLKKELIPFLESTLKAKRGETALHLEVRSIYVSWEPDDEQGPYAATIIFVCDDEDAVAHLDNVMLDKYPSEGKIRYVCDDLTVSIEVYSAGAMVLSDVDGLYRFSEWDYLTSLDEALD